MQKSAIKIGFVLNTFVFLHFTIMLHSQAFEAYLEAIQNDDIDRINQLINYEREIYQPLSEVFVPNSFGLFLNCANIKAAHYLVKKGFVESNFMFAEKKSVFSASCECGELEFVKEQIISKSIGVDVLLPKNQTCLMLAAENGHKDVVEFLISQKANVNHIDDKNHTALILNVKHSKNGKVGIVNVLIENNVDVNYKGGKLSLTALYYAILNDKNEILQVLWNTLSEDEKALTLKEQRLFSSAAHTGNIYAMNLLLPYCQQYINKENILKKTPLQYAIEYAINFNALVDSTSINFNTNKDSLVVQFLLNNGADVNQLNKQKQTVLFQCYYLPIMVRMLVENGININMVDKHKKTALQYLADEIIQPPIFVVNGVAVELWQSDEIQNRLKLMEYYISKGAVVNCSYQNGWSYLLFEAVQHNRMSIIQYLLDKKIDLNIKDKKNKTALDYAIKEEKTAIIRLLLKNGAKRGKEL